MKTIIMQRGILIILSTMLSATVLVAQPSQGRQGPPPMPDASKIVEMIEELEQTLNLTPTQKNQITNLYNTHFEEVTGLMESGKVSRNTMERLKKNFHAQIESVLSEAQFKEFQTLQRTQRPQQPRKR